MSPRPSRRGFLKLLGLAAAGAALPFKAAATYAAKELSVPIAWSTSAVGLDKIAMVRQLLDNAIRSHDDAIEEALFTVRSTRMPTPYTKEDNEWVEGRRNGS